MKMNCHKKTVNRAAMEAPARHSTTATLGLVLLLVSGQAKANNASHAPDPQGITVEHAQFVPVAGKNQVDIYLTIYNALANDARIKNVVIPGYRDMTVIRRTADFSGYQAMALQQAYIGIPKRTELFMGPDTFFLRASTDSPASKTVANIQFSNDVTIKVPLNKTTPDLAPIPHHHGIGDFMTSGPKQKEPG
ncbi:hypothetical protein [Allorhizobium borbori]|uniref:Copper(I)-binding protein n=1 Tax=Allorhizobium borbori TaxID=485907 RepID=A0A7W6K0R2_9HYPH|nr:hypothetical protein [Allorhizobium borbori]MBB4103075.1 hypothetical protein [Allorhizobium borbori]